MNRFLATLDRLSSEFAEDVVRAVRQTSPDELARLLGRELAPAASSPAPIASGRARPARLERAAAPARRVRHATGPSAALRSAPALEAAPEAAPLSVRPAPAALLPLSPHAEQTVRRFFEECGRRGATAQQVQRYLEHDETDPRVPNLIAALTREGVLRDAGFRRTTGNGTQPVFLYVGA